MSATTGHVRLKVIGCLLKRLSDLGATFTVCCLMQAAVCRVVYLATLTTVVTNKANNVLDV